MNDEPKKDNYKWVALALLTVGYFMQQGTRQIFNAVLPQMKAEFSTVSAADWGTVMSWFAAIYGVSVLFAGVLGDLFSRKKVILVSVVMFSAAVLACGFAQTGAFLSLVAYFILLYGIVFAVGQCLLPSSSTSLLSQLHDKTRSTALSIMQSALYVAVVFVSLLAGWLSGQGQGAWRYPFWIFGGFGLLWFVVMALFLRDTKPLPPVPGAPAKASMREAFGAFVKKPSAWLLMVAFGFQVFTNFGFTVWTPVFMKDAYYGNAAATRTAVSKESLPDGGTVFDFGEERLFGAVTLEGVQGKGSFNVRYAEKKEDFDSDDKGNVDVIPVEGDASVFAGDKGKRRSFRFVKVVAADAGLSVADVKGPDMPAARAARDGMLHSVLWHYIGCILGIMLASRISDKLARKWRPARMTMNFVGLLLGAPCIFMSYYTNSLMMCGLGLFLFGFAHGIYDSNMFAALYDVIKPRYRASSTGFMCCGAFLVGAIAPKLIGAMMDSGVTVKNCLSSLSVAYLAGAVTVLFTILLFLKRDYEGTLK